MPFRATCPAHVIRVQLRLETNKKEMLLKTIPHPDLYAICRIPRESDFIVPCRASWAKQESKAGNAKPTSLQAAPFHPHSGKVLNRLLNYFGSDSVNVCDSGLTNITFDFVRVIFGTYVTFLA